MSYKTASGMIFNTMFAGTDEFNFQRQSLLKSKVPFDLTDETSCAGFTIEGTEPPNTKRRIVFEIDGQLYKFGNSGLIQYEERGEAEDIIEGGNTVAELLELSNIPAFVGKKIYPVIALQADDDAQLMPKIRLKLKVNSFNDRYLKNEFSPEYDLGEGSKIHELKVSTYTNGNANVTTYARIYNDGWSDWDYTSNFANKKASKIQYKINYLLSTLDGSDFGAVNYIRCLYTTDADKLSGSTQNIISLAQDYPADLKTCYALIKHDELVDAEIKAYVNFSPELQRRENIMVGTTTGENQTIYLAYNGVIDTGILQDTIHIEIGGKPCTDFFYDTENSTITLPSQPPDEEILASYDCVAAENWLEMDKDFTQADGNHYTTRFKYRLANNQNMRRAAVKFEIIRLSANVDSNEISSGTGKLQIFALPHKAKAETLSATGNFVYDEGAQILKTVVNIDNPVTVGYSFTGNLPKIYSYIAGFSID